MHDPAAASPNTTPPRPPAGLPAWALGPMFLCVAAWLYFFSPIVDVPRGEVRVVARESFAPGALRKATTEPPRALVGGYEHGCVECHRLFDSPPVERRTLMQHTNITLEHGMNDRCFNCHDRENRARLALHDGTLLDFNQVPRLCSQCHGTVFRDWQRGTHGKTMGSWDAAGGGQHRLDCNDCHDPHSPAYKPVAPLPGPSTLRMGDQAHGAHEEPRHNPLRRRSSGHGTEPPEEHP